MKKENFFLTIRCDRCQEKYRDDCIDCIEKQKSMGVKVEFYNDRCSVGIAYQPNQPIKPPENVIYKDFREQE